MKPSDGAPRPVAATGLPVVPGLDTLLGLSHTGGKFSLYLNVLRRFVAAGGAEPQQIAAALQAGDRATAERVAHTLKGVAATIGAVEVQRLAEQIESGTRSGQDKVQLLAAIEPLERTLLALNRELTVQLGPVRS